MFHLLQAGVRGAQRLCLLACQDLLVSLRCEALNGVATRTRTHSQPNVSSAIIAGLDRF